LSIDDGRNAIFKNNHLLEQVDDSSDESGSGNEINTYSRETGVRLLNESLQSVSESPVRWKRIRGTNYAKYKSG
jgi:hypothetical protein